MIRRNGQGYAASGEQNQTRNRVGRRLAVGIWATILAAGMVTLPLVAWGPARPVAAIPSPNGPPGYWEVGSDGGVFAIGGVNFFGSTGSLALNRPIVGMTATADGGGYWMVASDGGIFSFGNASFFGSTGNLALNKPVVGMEATLDGRGYWLVASDGGIFSFGDASFFGSTGSLALNRPIVGMATTSVGRGYWLVASDGGIFSFGDAPFRGSVADLTLASPIAAIAQGPGLPGFQGPGAFPPATTGNDISWPQCIGSGPGANVPGPATVAIVGANDGRASTPNPCLAAEWNWAGPGGNLYMNINWDGSANTTQEGHNFGFAAAQYAVNYAASQGATAKVWWLDVELFPPNPNYWSSNQQVNAAIIQGALDGLQAMGTTGGIYSTITQWNAITGGYPTSAPEWVPGAGPLAQAVTWCQPGALRTGNPANGTVAFSHGPVWLIQYGYVSPQPPFDVDYSC